MGQRTGARSLSGALFLSVAFIWTVPLAHAATPAPRLPPALPRTSGTSTSFTYSPTRAPIGSTIKINGTCEGEITSAAVGLFRPTSDVPIDLVTDLAGTRWTTVLHVKGPSGAAEIRGFCTYGYQHSVKRVDAGAIHPFSIDPARIARSDAGTPTPVVSALALPAKTTSSSFPVLPLALAVGGVAVMGAGVLARKPLLAAVGVGATTDGGQRKTARRDDGKHPLCITSWETTSQLTVSARTKVAKRYAKDLGEIGTKFSDLLAAIDHASDAFGPLRHEDEDEAPSDEELNLANRILDGLGKAVR